MCRHLMCLFLSQDFREICVPQPPPTHKFSHQIGAGNHVVLRDDGTVRLNELEYLNHT